MHSELVLLKCNTNQVSALLHYALGNLIYFNCGLVSRWFCVKISGQMLVREKLMSNVLYQCPSEAFE